MSHATSGGTMPQHSGDIFQESDPGLTVVARAVPGRDRRTYLRLAGEIDMASSPVLSKTVDWLTASAPVSLLVDLSELTFAGSALPNFVVRVRHALPDGAELILWRAGQDTEWVLRATNMDIIATIRDEPAEPLDALV